MEAVAHTAWMKRHSEMGNRAINLVIIFAVMISTAASQCSHGDVRLVGGSGEYEGNVQICNQGTWGWVCHSYWGTQEAQVVCRQLEYDTTYTSYRTASYYGYGSGTIWLNYMQCTGSEDKLLDCDHTYDIGITYCGYNHLAGVFCSFGGGCTPGDIRLSNYGGRSEGRIEVCYNNEWGTVCNDYFDSNDARVACTQLGYYYHYTYSTGFGGYGVGSIWMDNMGCSGSELSLFDCPGIIGSSSCGHYEDIGVRCYSRDFSSCSNGEIRLWNPYNTTSSGEGVLQICKSGQWYSTCDRYANCYTAKTACKQLGYEGALYYRTNGGYYYGYYYYNDNYYYQCSSYATSLSQCSYYSSQHCYYSHYNWYCNYYCGDYYDALSVVCYDPSNGAEKCDNAGVRLVDGQTNNEGRVEYCYNGAWSPVCQLDSTTAVLICKALGYTQYKWGLMFDDERFGRSDISSNFDYVSCSSSDTDLSECTTHNEVSTGCYVSTSVCSTEYGLRCYTPGNCSDGEVRILDGDIVQEGRPEICIDGVWGSICQTSWNAIDGYVFCNMLGYDGPNPIIYYGSEFGVGDGPIIWSSVYCNGWELDIHQCTKTVLPNFDCYSSNIAGVTCKESCQEGNVRLVGGDFENEGTVEVCLDNLWGLIADTGWTDGDAKVVCSQLGYTDGITLPKLGSYYGKPNKIIHLEYVSCIGKENDLTECTNTQLSFENGKLALLENDVAGVDCIYDVPTEPPCVKNPAIDSSNACSSPGAVRLMNYGNLSTTEGRVDYCYNDFWTPLCTMDRRVATVVCRQLGHLHYSWGAVVEGGEFDTLLNYSLVANITCSGSESSISECTTYKPEDDCFPKCTASNIGLRCFDPGQCEEGSIRLADGIIEQEGRLEVCVNEVWGSVCDEGWDKTDAHVICQQLGYSDLEPIAFYNSYFGDGIYPIVYSKVKCGGWELDIADCQIDTFLEFSCSRGNVAGLLCGYDCENGDIRLVGGNLTNEGTIEVCFDNLWGLIDETGWTSKDAEVVCRQLGYAVEGTVSHIGSFFGKPDKTVHLSNIQCMGDEENLNECTKTVFSLEEGKNKLKTVQVAGVECYVPNECLPPPAGGSDCVNGNLRLTGVNANNGEGILEYCYKGLWSTFCSLSGKEALVACRQLGYMDFDLVSIFTDGRFDPDASNTSLFQNFSCSIDDTHLSLSECSIADSCQSSCSNAFGIRCYESANCEEGAVRLKNGKIGQEGRIEVCSNNVWGSICGDGFDKTDAYVVCKELGLGLQSEPTVYTNSFFGDGDIPIVYSNMGCRGYEASVLECTKERIGTFSCSRDNIAGVICQDACEDGVVRLVGGSQNREGTVEICYFNLWGTVSVSGWDDIDAGVVCYTLDFEREGAIAFTDSRYGKPDKTVHLSNVDCDGSEYVLDQCDSLLIPADEGKELYKHIDVAGVSCKPYEPPMNSTSFVQPSSSPVMQVSSTSTTSKTSSGFINENAAVISLVLGVLLLIAILIIISMTICMFFRRRKMKKNIRDPAGVTMSSLQQRNNRGVINPVSFDDEYEDMQENEYDSVKNGKLVQ